VGNVPTRLPSAVSATLNLLRAVAAGLVVVQHVRIVSLANWEQLAPTERGPLRAAFYLATSCGHAAVIAFFVMSGYLVGGGFLVDLAAGRASLSRYVTSRVSRIYTVLVPALVLGFAMDHVSMDVLHSALANDALPIRPPTLAAFLGNLLSLQTIVVPALGTNVALWSLANEFWYYLLWPLAILPFAPRQPMRRRVVLLASAAAICALTYPAILALFPLWCLGALARVAPRPLVRSRAAAGCLALLAFVSNRFGRSVLDGWASDLVTSVGLANLLVTMRWRDEVVRARWSRWAAAFADFSYSLYATHLPVVVLSATVLNVYFGAPAHPPLSPRTAVVSTALVASAYAFAWWFSRWTERRTTVVRDYLERAGIAAVRWAPRLAAAHDTSRSPSAKDPPG
jgi:peptidoglycan/LPS O-acetylase OafA/YrhL